MSKKTRAEEKPFARIVSEKPFRIQTADGDAYRTFIGHANRILEGTDKAAAAMKGTIGTGQLQKWLMTDMGENPSPYRTLREAGFLVANFAESDGGVSPDGARVLQGWLKVNRDQLSILVTGRKYPDKVLLASRQLEGPARMFAELVVSARDVVKQIGRVAPSPSTRVVLQAQ